MDSNFGVHFAGFNKIDCDGNVEMLVSISVVVLGKGVIAVCLSCGQECSRLDSPAIANLLKIVLYLMLDKFNLAYVL